MVSPLGREVPGLIANQKDVRSRDYLADKPFGSELKEAVPDVRRPVTSQYSDIHRRFPFVVLPACSLGIRA
jgi:hypothetical protein